MSTLPGRRTILVLMLALSASLVEVVAAPNTQTAGAAAEWSHRAVADTHTRADAKTSNYGTSPRWSVDARSAVRRHALLRFDVDAPPQGRRIVGAYLRAHSNSASTGSGVSVYTTGSPWTERGVTWRNQPARRVRLARQSGYAANTWVEWNVTRAMRGKGAVRFRLETKERKLLSFKSRESKLARAPVLRIVTAPVTASRGCGTSGVAMPRGNIPGWRQVFADDFTTNVPIGSFPGRVYGPKWGAYADGWKDTTGNGTYMPSKVLSVRKCALDYFIHTERGVRMVSAPTPKIPPGAYGKYVVRFRADALRGYKTAWLLWPDSGVWPRDGEIDWPEGDLNETMSGYMHFANPRGGQNWFHTAGRYPKWHTATTTWTAGKVTFALDGRVFGTSTTQVPNKPMHWVLQTETSTKAGVVPAASTQGHVQIDWVVAYKASRAATPTPTPTRPATAPGRNITLGAVGDINPDGQSGTSTRAGLLASSVKRANVDALALLGDWQYQYGDCRSMVNEFDTTGLGGLLPKTIGTAGPTHDWTSFSDTASYRNHMAGTCPGQTSRKSLSSTAWGSNVGPATSHWVDLGKWRVFSVSSGLWRYNTRAANTATSWLDRELARGKAAGDHAVVIWHEPYWSSGTTGHPRTLTPKPWIDMLDKYNVKLVMHGHQHAYERFHPQNANGTRNDATGTQAFVVGTGGIGFYPFQNTLANSATKQANTWGWLKLTLKPGGHYAWAFTRIAGGSFTDTGTR